jgi:hypothetical protein
MDSEWFDCECKTMEHSIRFMYDEEDNELYMDVFLANGPFWRRLWRGILYIIGYRSSFGDSTNVIFQKQDKERLLSLINKL